MTNPSEQLKKGCGRCIDFEGSELYGLKKCGETILLCPSCQARLDQRQKDLKEELEFLESIFQILDINEFEDIGQFVNKRIEAIKTELKNG